MSWTRPPGLLKVYLKGWLLSQTLGFLSLCFSSLENTGMLMLVKSLHLCFIALVCYMLLYPKSKELTSFKWRKYSSRWQSSYFCHREKLHEANSRLQKKGPSSKILSQDLTTAVSFSWLSVFSWFVCYPYVIISLCKILVLLEIGPVIFSSN